MSPEFRAWFLSLLLLALTMVFVPIGDSIWFSWFLNDEIYTVAFGWLSWADLIRWLYVAIAFAFLGGAQRVLGGAWRSNFLAVTVGSIYSLIWCARSTYYFADAFRTIDYIWTFGDHLIPPLASYGGASLMTKVIGRAK